MSPLTFALQRVTSVQVTPPTPPAPPAPSVPISEGVLIAPPEPPEIQMISPELIEEQVQAALAQSQFQFGIHDPMYVPGELIGGVVVSLLLILLMIVGYPIARAIARRMDRTTNARADAALPTGDVLARLERIEHAVETMAVEIERISEGQRFTNRLMSERARGVGAGNPAGD